MLRRSQNAHGTRTADVAAAFDAAAAGCSGVGVPTPAPLLQAASEHDKTRAPIRRNCMMTPTEEKVPKKRDVSTIVEPLALVV